MKKRKSNWLLFTGLGLITLLLLLINFIEINFSQSSRAILSFSSFQFYAITAIIIAPIVEEFAFRGNFFKNKTLKYISLAAFLGLCVLEIASGNYLGYVAVLYLLLFLLDDFKLVELNKRILLSFSAIIFGVIHYEFIDFKNFDTAILILAQTGAGFILTWVFLNFKYTYSVITHAVYNGVILSVTAYVLATPDTTTQFYEDDTVKVSYEKAPLNFKNAGVSITSDTVLCTNCSLDDIVGMLGKEYAEANDIKSQNSFVQYNLKATSKNLNFIEDKNALDFLFKTKLIYK